MFWVEKFCWIIRVVKYSGCLSGSELGLRAVASLPSCNLPLAVLVWGSLSFSLPPGKANFAFLMTLSRNGCAGRGGVPGGVTATAGVDPKGWMVSGELCRAGQLYGVSRGALHPALCSATAGLPAPVARAFPQPEIVFFYLTACDVCFFFPLMCSVPF